ncbi:hypothetical protein [Candidatus Aalborgicola defluviihabitans]|uniref:hypothetical protein n=1 Tax=Candidatus Aalborgicola defluviihabitans TaxID=3386187 RepID=UPI001EB68169|nr:hypothetical protein [Burkholderiales bacterium]
MNARIDGIQFWAKLKNNQLTYSEGSGCSLKVKFGKNGATIFQSETWCGDEHPYLYAAGKYKRISSEPDRHSCRLE